MELFTLGERIIIHRRRRHISAKELAERLGVSPSTMSQWERGRREPDCKTIMKIREILEVPEEERWGYNLPPTYKGLF